MVDRQICFCILIPRIQYTYQYLCPRSPPLSVHSIQAPRVDPVFTWSILALEFIPWALFHKRSHKREKKNDKLTGSDQRHGIGIFYLIL